MKNTFEEYQQNKQKMGNVLKTKRIAGVILITISLVILIIGFSTCSKYDNSRKLAFFRSSDRAIQDNLFSTKSFEGVTLSIIGTIGIGMGIFLTSKVK